MRFRPWPAARVQRVAQPPSPATEQTEAVQCTAETEFVGASDEDSDGEYTVSAGSDASEDVDEVRVQVASPRGVMATHILRRNSEGVLVHVCCPRLNAGDRDEGTRGRTRVRE